MIVMITGAGGFLGSHLMLHHLHAGDIVCGIDSFSSSDSDSYHNYRIRKLCKGLNRGMLVSGDVTHVCDLYGVYDAFVEHIKKCPEFHEQLIGDKLLYNFACPASPKVYQTIPVYTMMTCTLGVKNVLDFTYDRGFTVVHASTSEIYGNPNVSPQSESYLGYVNSYGPRSCYDEGKRAAEALCFDYNEFQKRIRIARIFNTYGPHLHHDDGRVVMNFIKQALNDDDITVYGDGLQTRSFCYVNDLIEAIVALGRCSLDLLPGPINVGNPEECTINHVAETIVACTNSKSNIVYQPLPLDDPMQRRPDITLAQKLLAWKPKVSLVDGIKRTINYYRSELMRLNKMNEVAC